MNKINQWLDQITERMLISFTAGMIGGVAAVIMQAFVSQFIAPVFAQTGTISPTVVEADSKAPVWQEITTALHAKPLQFKLQRTALSKAVSRTDIRSFITVDLTTGVVLAELNSAVSYPIASITKLMTAIVALDLAKPEQLFTISENAAQQIPTKIGIVAGEKMTLAELLEASLITSANDATQAIAEGINTHYGEDIFIRAMNEKAHFLGLTNTQFQNPQGFDDGKNYSTSSDLAVLIHYALQNYPTLAEITATEYKFLPANNHHKQFDLYNWNGLIGVYPSVTGVKIGNTQDAKYTTSVISERQGTRLLVVSLGAATMVERDLIAAELLDDGFVQAIDAPPIAISETQLKEKYASWKFWK